MFSVDIPQGVASVYGCTLYIPSNVKLKKTVKV